MEHWLVQTGSGLPLVLHYHFAKLQIPLYQSMHKVGGGGGGGGGLVCGF